MKDVVKWLMAAYAAGYEKGKGGNQDFNAWWISNQDKIKDLYVKLTMEVINEIKQEYNDTITKGE